MIILAKYCLPKVMLVDESWPNDSLQSQTLRLMASCYCSQIGFPNHGDAAP